MRLRTPLVCVALACLLLVGGASSVALAQSDGADTEPVVVGSPEITVGGLDVVVEDLDLPAPTDRTYSFGERTYEVDRAVLDVDGLSVTIDGQKYRFCQVTVVVEDTSVTLRDVTVGA